MKYKEVKFTVVDGEFTGRVYEWDGKKTIRHDTYADQDKFGEVMKAELKPTPAGP